MRRVGLASVVLLSLAMAPVAVARVRATAAQRTALIAAVVRQRQLSHAQAVCQSVTVSTVDRSYAALTWPAKLSPACRRVAANGVILEHHAAGGWRLVTVGSALRCPIRGVPAAVARDLRVCS